MVREGRRGKEGESARARARTQEGGGGDTTWPFTRLVQVYPIFNGHNLVKGAMHDSHLALDLGYYAVIPENV